MADKCALIFRLYPGDWKGFAVEDAEFGMVWVDSFPFLLLSLGEQGPGFFRHRSAQQDIG